jgi:hypothetical protein
MIKDITIILSVLILTVAVLQLRFSRLKIAKTLQWIFIILMAVILILQTLKTELFIQNRTFLNSIFWISVGGIFILYYWIKKEKKRVTNG